jgi:hypothetical protein
LRHDWQLDARQSDIDLLLVAGRQHCRVFFRQPRRFDGLDWVHDEGRELVGIGR